MPTPDSIGLFPLNPYLLCMFYRDAHRQAKRIRGSILRIRNPAEITLAFSPALRSFPGFILSKASGKVHGRAEWRSSRKLKYRAWAHPAIAFQRITSPIVELPGDLPPFWSAFGTLGLAAFACRSIFLRTRSLPAHSVFDLGIGKGLLIHIFTEADRRFASHDLADVFLFVLQALKEISIKDFLPAAVIYGPNGEGKSQLSSRKRL